MIAEPSSPFLLEIVSDTICPWCYVAKRRLDLALAMFAEPLPLSIVWRPYELNPDMPREGLDRVAYRSKKFGSWARSQALDAQVTAAGAAAGLTFRHDLMKRTPNTLASHVLIDLAGETGDPSKVAEAVFRAYFSEGRDIGDGETLVAIGVAKGLDETAIRLALANESRQWVVRKAAEAFRQAGVNSVPNLILNGFILTSGTTPVDRLASLLQTGVTDQRVIEAGRRTAAS